MSVIFSVIPAKAGTQSYDEKRICLLSRWAPAFAGVTTA